MPYNYTGLTRNRSPRLASVKGRQDFSRMLRSYMTAQFPALRASKAADEEQRLREESFDLEKDRLAEEERQGKISTGLSAASTGLTTAMALKSGAGAAGAGAGAAPVAGAGAGAGGAGAAGAGAGSMAPASSGGLSSAGPWGLLAAAIISNESYARGKGYRSKNDKQYAKDLFSGEVFHQDMEKRWLPKLGIKEGSAANKIGSIALNPFGGVTLDPKKTLDRTKKAVKAITGWSW